VRIELVEVNLKRGVNEREATAYNYYQEEWPEEFIFHGASDDISVDEGGRLPYQLDRAM